MQAQEVIGNPASLQEVWLKVQLGPSRAKVYHQAGRTSYLLGAYARLVQSRSEQPPQTQHCNMAGKLILASCCVLVLCAHAAGKRNAHSTYGSCNVLILCVLMTWGASLLTDAPPVLLLLLGPEELSWPPAVLQAKLVYQMISLLKLNSPAALLLSRRFPLYRPQDSSTR